MLGFIYDTDMAEIMRMIKAKAYKTRQSRRKRKSLRTKEVDKKKEREKEIKLETAFGD